MRRFLFPGVLGMLCTVDLCSAGQILPIEEKKLLTHQAAVFTDFIDESRQIRQARP